MRPHSRHYQEVLASDRWRGVRVEAIRRAGYRCESCGRGGRLDVHHAYGYRNLGHEDPSELQALCRTCHDTVHAQSQSQMVNAGCLKVLVWVVAITIVLHLISWLIMSVIHG